jgi:hypothetical protein
LGSPFCGKFEQCVGCDGHVCCLAGPGYGVRDLLVYLETGCAGRVWSCVLCDECDYPCCNNLANVGCLKRSAKGACPGNHYSYLKCLHWRHFFRKKNIVQFFTSLQEVPQLSAQSASDPSRHQHWAASPYWPLRLHSRSRSAPPLRPRRQL